MKTSTIWIVGVCVFDFCVALVAHDWTAAVAWFSACCGWFLLGLEETRT